MARTPPAPLSRNRTGARSHSKTTPSSFAACTSRRLPGMFASSRREAHVTENAPRRLAGRGQSLPAWPPPTPPAARPRGQVHGVESAVGQFLEGDLFAAPRVADELDAETLEVLDAPVDDRLL